MSKGVYVRKKSVWNKGLTKETSEIIRKQGKAHSRRMKGVRWNKESIDKRVKSNTGKKRNAISKRNISNGRKGMKFSREHKDKISRSKTGNKNPNWLGGKTLEYSSRFNKSIWKNIRRLVLQRDNYTCQKCGKTQKILDVHHKKPWRFSKDDDVDNLVSLCRSCHRKEDLRLQKILIAKKTKVKNRIIIVYTEFLNSANGESNGN